MTRLASILITLLLLNGCNQGKDPLTLAVAANFAPCMEALLEEFTPPSGLRPEMIRGASGKLLIQIESGAPVDFFFAADEYYSRQVPAKYDPGTPVPYAIGHLAFWSKHPVENGDWRNFLREEEVEKLALPNPELAPYGAAARELLKREGLLERLQPKLVLGEGVGHTSFMLATGAMDAGFVSWSLNFSGEFASRGNLLRVSDSLDAGIRQEYIALGVGEPHPDAKAFETFLQGEKARKIIESFGYSLP